ncbi:aminoglycoside phosphotransferase [Bifidobacterium xylocopae]|uniref:Aminoglycoside phosphotransferase n=2 Tax=Bifidobacterium xylocopae TaxID=2493119 RepID=A0A366KDA2_9BIFI|nr:aminoglycoside phosphotransferase [Bifidobacterium xylocopae]
MPDAYFTGARASDQVGPRDEAEGIDCAIVQNASGRLYDIWATSSERGKARLDKRVKAAEALEDVRGMRALGFGVEQVVRYQDGSNPKGPTGDVAVAIMAHSPGHTRSLKLLTADECSAVGTAIGAVHRIDPAALRERFYPAYSTRQIAGQLKAWISNLRKAGHVPREITDSWSRIVRTEGLWSFETCMVHGGYTDGDFLFTDSGLSAIHNWQGMQVNDPARDLAWIFAKLDQAGRDAVVASYGRMRGSHLDDLIMLRANLWLQMEQVGDFILALDRADNERIIRFKAQVEHLAQQLADSLPKTYAPAIPGGTGTGNASAEDDAPSTVTVGTLLDADRRVEADESAGISKPSAPASPARPTQEETDATVIRPAYKRVKDADLAGIQGAGAPTGRHAAVRPPTLPDMTGSHLHLQAGSGEPGATAASGVDGEARTGRHSAQARKSAEAEPSPTSTRTEAIDLARMKELALAQAERSRQRHHDNGGPFGQETADDAEREPPGLTDDGRGADQEAETIVIERSRATDSAHTRTSALAGSGTDVRSDRPGEESAPDSHADPIGGDAADANSGTGTAGE